MDEVDELIDMADDEFTEIVLAAAKRREHFPAWWRAVLRPEVIDETENVIRDAMADARRQAENPERFPQAAGFARKMQAVLAEVRLAKMFGVE